MFTLVLYAFLAAGPDGQVRTVHLPVDGKPYATYPDCLAAKAVAIEEAKLNQWTHIGGGCVPLSQTVGGVR